MASPTSTAAVPSRTRLSTTQPIAATRAPPALPVRGNCAATCDSAAPRTAMAVASSVTGSSTPEPAPAIQASVPTAIGSVNVAVPPAVSATRLAYGPKRSGRAVVVTAVMAAARARPEQTAAVSSGRARLVATAYSPSSEPTEARTSALRQVSAVSAAEVAAVLIAAASTGTAHQVTVPV